MPVVEWRNKEYDLRKHYYSKNLLMQIRGMGMNGLWLLSDYEKGQIVEAAGMSDGYSDVSTWEGVVIALDDSGMTVNFCVREKWEMPMWDVIRLKENDCYLKGMPCSPEIFMEIDKGHIPEIPTSIFEIVLEKCSHLRD